MTVVPGQYNITIYQGSNFSQELTFLQSAGGAPLDLTGLAVRMQIRKTKAASAVMIELTTANGRLVSGGALGTVTMQLNAEETATLKSNGFYDVEVVYGPTSVERWLEGEVTVELEVTR